MLPSKSQLTGSSREGDFSCRESIVFSLRSAPIFASLSSTVRIGECGVCVYIRIPSTTRYSSSSCSCAACRGSCVGRLRRFLPGFILRFCSFVCKFFDISNSDQSVREHGLVFGFFTNGFLPFRIADSTFVNVTGNYH